MTFNILNFISSLSREQKEYLLRDQGWWSLIEDEMAKDIVNEFSRENFNSIYTDLRTNILNSESMPKIIQEWAKAMLGSTAHAKEAERYWSQAYYELLHYVQERTYDHRDIPKLPDRNYGVEYSKELMEEVKQKAEEWAALFPNPAKEEE